MTVEACPDIKAAVERTKKRAREIEAHLAKYPRSFPEADQHAADIRLLHSALQEARGDAAAFCAVWAVPYARERGLPEGHIFSVHYDILERNGARMADFTRHEPDRALSPGGANGAD